MLIFRPIRTNRLNQGFGENKACINNSGDVVVKFGEFCPHNYEPLYFSYGMKGHNGEDWASWHGEPLYHGGDYVGYAKTHNDTGGGLGIDIISKDKYTVNDKQSYVKLRYWHLKSFVVSDGEEVRPGQLIGYCDNTGASSGDHLHWSLKLVDDKGETLNKDNGYYGAVDFRPHFQNEFILDVLGVKEIQLSLIALLRKVVSLLQLQLKLSTGMDIHKATRSSVNPENLSLTIKGILVALLPGAIYLGGYYGLNITETALLSLIEQMTAVLSALMVSWGIVRKFLPKK